MNKRGQTVMLTIVIALFIYFFGVLFIKFIDIEAHDAALTNTSLFINGTSENYGGPGLDCGSSANPNLAVSDGTKLTCLATDAVVPYFILGLISVAGGLITSKLLR